MKILPEYKRLIHPDLFITGRGGLVNKRTSTASFRPVGNNTALLETMPHDRCRRACV
jgi:hypothetical protein